MAGIILRVIRMRAKPPRPLIIREIHLTKGTGTTLVVYATQCVTTKNYLVLLSILVVHDEVWSAEVLKLVQ